MSQALLPLSLILVTTPIGLPEYVDAKSAILIILVTAFIKFEILMFDSDVETKAISFVFFKVATVYVSAEEDLATSAVLLSVFKESIIYAILEYFPSRHLLAEKCAAKVEGW